MNPLFGFGSFGWYMLAGGHCSGDPTPITFTLSEGDLRPASTCTTKICVNACGGLPVLGATVEILDGAQVVASCMTDSSGCCTVNVAGTYTVRISYGGQIVYSQKVNLCKTATITLGSNSGLVCCGGYAIPKVLTLTDATGSLSFVYFSGSTPPTWAACHVVTRTSLPLLPSPFGGCLIGSATSGSLAIGYTMKCNVGSSPVFHVTRIWTDIADGHGGFGWLQDGGFYTGCVGGSTFPVACGGTVCSGGVQTFCAAASFDANPSATSPFTLSGTPVVSGTSHTSDPIGGTVVISG